MIENILTKVIVLICILAVGYRVYRQVSGRGGCGCSDDKGAERPLQKKPFDLRSSDKVNGEKDKS